MVAPQRGRLCGSGGNRRGRVGRAREFFFLAQEKDMLCRHCGKCVVSRPRGLCWACFYEPGIRELYPPTSKYARQGLNYSYDEVRPSRMPTRAEPGSPQKVAVLEK